MFNLLAFTFHSIKALYNNYDDIARGNLRNRNDRSNNRSKTSKRNVKRNKRNVQTTRQNESPSFVERERERDECERKRERHQQQTHRKSQHVPRDVEKRNESKRYVGDETQNKWNCSKVESNLKRNNKQSKHRNSNAKRQATNFRHNTSTTHQRDVEKRNESKNETSETKRIVKQSKQTQFPRNLKGKERNV